MELPNLDDKTYPELVAEAIAQIPLEYPEWTDHNPSDTGIILIELFAWLTEMTLYQVNQIPDQNYASFISLLKGENWTLPNLSEEERKKRLHSAIKDTLSQLRHRYRAVTTEDYEKLVLEDWPNSPEFNNLKIARVNCLAQRNLEQLDIDTFAQGHISLVVVPETNNNHNYDELFDFLDKRRLLTTRIHLVEPSYISITIDTQLVIHDGAQAEAVKDTAKQELKLFFHPLQSEKYWQGKGWPFGRGIYLSQLYKILDDLEGVDYVADLAIKDQNQEIKSEIHLKDNELVDLNLENSTFTIIVEVGNEQQSI